MEEPVLQELLAKTEQALLADDWNAVERIWQPWIEQGEAEAEFQLGYTYLQRTTYEDRLAKERMEAFINSAAKKDHPDAIWFLATRQLHSQEVTGECKQRLLRSGELGSRNAQRLLGVLYATGDCSWPVDLARAAHWYRRAAEGGDTESQFDLGFMLLLGEGEPKNTEEGLRWLERAGEQGHSSACGVLADCYEEGHCDVPVDALEAARWRKRLDEYERLHPPKPHVSYVLEEVVSQSSAALFMTIEGVTGYGYAEGHREISVYFDPAIVERAELDERVRAAGIAAVRTDEDAA